MRSTGVGSLGKTWADGCSREAAGPQERDPATETGVGYITGSTLTVGHLARLFTTIHIYWTTSFFSDNFKISQERKSVNIS